MEQTKPLRIVDVACRLGNSFGEFIKTGSAHFMDDPMIRVIQPEECLGLDADPRFWQDLEGRGYGFRRYNLLQDPLADLPESDYYVVWNYLDSLPDKTWADAVVATAIHKARKGVWLRLLSFEQDTLGEGPLHELGLRFAWTRHPAHPLHYPLDDAVAAINKYKQESKRMSIDLKIKPGKRVYSTTDPCVIPESAPIGVEAYHPSTCGPKPARKLKTGLVAWWELIVTV